jgi:hypothetical protein
MFYIYKLTDPTTLFNGAQDDLELAQERGCLKGEVFAAQNVITGALSYHAPCYGLPVMVSHPEDLPRTEVETMQAIIARHNL